MVTLKRLIQSQLCEGVHHQFPGVLFAADKARQEEKTISVTSQQDFRIRIVIFRRISQIQFFIRFRQP